MLPDTIDPVRKSIIVRNYVENKRFFVDDWECRLC